MPIKTYLAVILGILALFSASLGLFPIQYAGLYFGGSVIVVGFTALLISKKAHK